MHRNTPTLSACHARDCYTTPTRTPTAPPAVLCAIYHLGFNRAGLLAGAGGLSVGLGFGVKEIFSNFISGLWLLFEGSVRPGEVLIIDGQPCEVRHMGLRAANPLRGHGNRRHANPPATQMQISNFGVSVEGV